MLTNPGYRLGICSTFFVAALLICPQAVVAQAPAEPEDRLCGPISDSNPAPRVLIGRFLQFGKFEANLSRNVEYALAGRLVAGLLSRSDASIFIWGRDSEHLRRFKDLSEQINNAFAGGTPPDQQRKSLVAALKAHNCQYLLAGRISQDGDVLAVTMYSTDVEEGGIRRSAPVLGDMVVLMQAADRFAAEFGLFLRQRRLGNAPVRWFAAGCVSVAAPLPIGRPETERLAGAMRQRLVQELANEKRFQVKPVSEKAVCAAPETVSGEFALVLTADLRRGRDTIEMRPVVRLPEAVAGSKISISLPSVVRPISEIVTLPADYANAVRSFLLVAIREDGSLPEEFLSAPPAPDRLWEMFEQDVQEQNIERSAFGAYRVLAAMPDSAVASYVLGRTFLSKAQPQLALDYLLRARKGQSADWPAQRRAELSEAAASAQQQLRRPSDSVEYFREAKSLYEQAGMPTDALRAGRGLAVALFMSGDKDKAFDVLRKQPNLETDIDTLRILGQFSVLSDQFSEGKMWLQKALALDPNDAVSKTSLADAYEAMGKEDFGAKRFREARENFHRAAEQRYSSRMIYLTAIAAYELKEFSEAAVLLEKAVADTTEAHKLSGKYLEAAWLTLLETYLLLGRYEELEKRFDAATEALASRPDARLLAAYIRFCAKAIGNSSQTRAELENDPIYQNIFASPPSASAMSLSSWDNTNVERLLAQADLPVDKRELVKTATERVWRDPKKLQ